ncbi:hypothetical protein M5689_001406 [Euphorbia peplus]|nr:hypothetical protein M5689_001406 [Euphorbia peplus]
MATQKGFFSKLFDPQLPQNSPFRSSSSSSSSMVHVESATPAPDAAVSELLASFCLDENVETTLPFDPFTVGESESKKKKTAENDEKPPPKTYPPPISCLKLFKKGKNCTYYSCNNNQEDEVVVEDVTVPNHDMFHANREGGRLRLYFALYDDDDDDAYEAEDEAQEDDEAQEEDDDQEVEEIEDGIFQDEDEEQN